jgi:hypothetical protein
MIQDLNNSMLVSDMRPDKQVEQLIRSAANDINICSKNAKVRNI